MTYDVNVKSEVITFWLSENVLLCISNYITICIPRSWFTIYLYEYRASFSYFSFLLNLQSTYMQVIHNFTAFIILLIPPPASRYIHSHPDDIELFSGGISERSVLGGVVGETFNCLITRQMRSLKFGDRYFFTHDRGNQGFDDGRSILLLSRGVH